MRCRQLVSGADWRRRAGRHGWSTKWHLVTSDDIRMLSVPLVLHCWVMCAMHRPVRCLCAACALPVRCLCAAWWWPANPACCALCCWVTGWHLAHGHLADDNPLSEPAGCQDCW